MFAGAQLGKQDERICGTLGRQCLRDARESRKCGYTDIEQDKGIVFWGVASGVQTGGTSIERRVFVYVRSPYNIEYRRWAKQKGAERARGPFRKDEQVKLFWESRKEEQITW